MFLRIFHKRIKICDLLVIKMTLVKFFNFVDNLAEVRLITRDENKNNLVLENFSKYIKISDVIHISYQVKLSRIKVKYFKLDKKIQRCHERIIFIIIFSNIIYFN